MITIKQVDKDYCKSFQLCEDDLKEKEALGIPYDFDDEAIVAHAIELNGKPLAIGGIHEDVIWLLTSPTVQELGLMKKSKFVRAVKAWLRMSQICNPEVPFFYNIVWSGLPNHHKFIETMGGIIDYDRPIQVETDEDFYVFHIVNPYHKAKE